MTVGYIRDDLDLKVLILYLMDRVIRPVTFQQLLELTIYLDPGVDYFSLTAAVPHMVQTGQLIQDSGRYAITERGRRNSSICEENLPYSIRLHCEENLLKVNEDLRLSEEIRAGIEERKDGTCMLHLRFSDCDGPLLELHLLVSSRPEAQTMSQRFLTDPSALYIGVVEHLATAQEEISP